RVAAHDTRREARVSALARERTELAAVPVHAGLAETGAGRDQRRVAARVDLAFAQRQEVLVRERGETVGVGLEIVDESHRSEIELARELARVDDPRQVRRATDAAADRTRDAEAGGVDEAPRARAWRRLRRHRAHVVRRWRA